MEFIYDKTCFFENMELLYNISLNDKIFMTIDLDSYINNLDIPYDHLSLSTIFEVYNVPKDINLLFKFFPDIYNIISHYPNYVITKITILIRESYHSKDYIESSILIQKM
jgi:hypothetical protein